MMQDIIIDPITGWENLFGLIESDTNSILGVSGNILYIDLMGIKEKNIKYGNVIGDTYIKCLAEIIENNLAQVKLLARKYRVGGDFILLFQEVELSNLNDLAEKISTELENSMIKIGIENAGIYYATWTYSEMFSSISSFLKQCKMQLEMKLKKADTLPEIPFWADDMIEKLFVRIKETIEINRDIKTLALMDDVSELANYKAAQMKLKALYIEHKKTEKPFSVLFIDGDNLKKYNDLSYQKGNQMIKQLAQGIAQAVRKEDFVFRWFSGDEFVVLLNDTDKYLALKLAERIRLHIEKSTKDFIYPVTISIGVASYPEDGEDIDSILQKAEQANAQAKRYGKNCVV
jgi:diguanylate cyclase (GGDEF)-like protein